MDIKIEEIVFLVNGVEHYLWGHVFEETPEALQVASRVAVFDGEPGKTGSWYQKDTIKSRRVISTVNSVPEPASPPMLDSLTGLDRDLRTLFYAGWRIELFIPSSLHSKTVYSASMKIENHVFWIEKANLAELCEHVMIVGLGWEKADPKPVFRHDGDKQVWLRKLLINKEKT